MPIVEDEEEKLVKSKKLEAIFGFDPYKDKDKEKPKEKTINVNEHLIEAVKVYQNLLIHRDEHVCKTKKLTSKAILASDDREGLSKTITTKSNLTQSYISSYLMGNAQKSFNAGSELELLDKDAKKAP